MSAFTKNGKDNAMKKRKISLLQLAAAVLCLALLAGCGSGVPSKPSAQALSTEVFVQKVNEARKDHYIYAEPLEPDDELDDAAKVVMEKAYEPYFRGEWTEEQLADYRSRAVGSSFTTAQHSFVTLTYLYCYQIDAANYLSGNYSLKGDTIADINAVNAVCLGTYAKQKDGKVYVTVITARYII